MNIIYILVACLTLTLNSCREAKPSELKKEKVIDYDTSKPQTMAIEVANASGGTRLLPVVHEPIQIVSIMFGAMFLSLLATLYPAYRAGKVSPVEALRYE